MADTQTTQLTPPGQGADPIEAIRAADAQTPAIQTEPEPTQGEEKQQLSETDFQVEQIVGDIARDGVVLEQLNAELDTAEALGRDAELNRISAQQALDKAMLAEKQAGRTVDALTAEHKRVRDRITRRRIMLAEAQAAQMERVS